MHAHPRTGRTDQRERAQCCPESAEHNFRPPLSSASSRLHACIRKHVHVHVCTHACRPIRMYVYIKVHMYLRIHTDLHVRQHVCTCAYRQIRMHVGCMYRRMRIYAQADAHIHRYASAVRMHTCARARARARADILNDRRALYLGGPARMERG